LKTTPRCGSELALRLEADGYRVDQAADGEDGLFQAREFPVDLAIVDLGLPKLNGMTIVQRCAPMARRCRSWS
jgi:DNA-binding response OmpR family regulator